MAFSNKQVRRFIESQVAFLTEIPSLLYGLLAITVFFSYAGIFKEIGTPSPIQNANASGLDVMPFQRNIAMLYVEVLIFIMMVMPVAIKTTQEALRSVATPIRESAYVLGANQWQVLAKQVVPLAFPRMLAGGCRAHVASTCRSCITYRYSHTRPYNRSQRNTGQIHVIFSRCPAIEYYFQFPEGIGVGNPSHNYGYPTRLTFTR